MSGKIKFQLGGIQALTHDAKPLEFRATLEELDEWILFDICAGWSEVAQTCEGPDMRRSVSVCKRCQRTTAEDKGRIDR